MSLNSTTKLFFDWHALPSLGHSLPLSTKEMEQRVLCGPTQPQESYDFMSPWLLSLDKLFSPQDHELRS